MSEIDHLQEARRSLSAAMESGISSMRGGWELQEGRLHATIAAAETLRDILAELRAQRLTAVVEGECVPMSNASGEWDPAVVAAGEDDA